jgi:hypothetical protein
MYESTETTSWMTSPEGSVPYGHMGELHSTSPILERALDAVESYGRKDPWSFAVVMIGIGFFLGWKLRPW